MNFLDALLVYAYTGQFLAPTGGLLEPYSLYYQDGYLYIVIQRAYKECDLANI